MSQKIGEFADQDGLSFGLIDDLREKIKPDWREMFHPFSSDVKIKDSVKKAVAFISNFETTAAEIAIEKKFDYVVCGHIHKPQMKEVSNENGKVIYLNSGDWVENLSALEYNKKKWRIYRYQKIDYTNQTQDSIEDSIINDIVSKILA
jgi:UDP-2,3-diacylglucosamine pyrophosphatase LpxH